MEIIEDYHKKTKTSKFKISDFFLKEEDSINLYNGQLVLEEDSLNCLKNHWVSEVESFVREHSQVKLVKDFYRVDFNELNNTRQISLNNKRLKQSVIDTHTNEVNKITKFNKNKRPLEDNVFIEKCTPSLSNFIYQNKINETRKKLTYEPALSKKDMLYYGVLDFVSKNDSNGTRSMFNTEEYNHFVKQLKSKFQKNKNVAKISKSILIHMNEGFDLEGILKESKKEMRNSTEDKSQRQLKKRIRKACKIYQNMNEDGKNLLEENNLNEPEYLYFFIAPILKTVLKDSKFIKLKFGEPNLKCAARKKNDQLNDEDRRQPGPKIDIIFLHKNYGLEIGICEVSGPNNKTDQNHFIGDRKKICRNLKAMFQAVERSTPTPDISSLKKLKLYGVHFYKNKLYLYSLSKPTVNDYAFLPEKEFDIPVTMALLQQYLPKFFGQIWILVNAFEQMNNELNTFFAASMEESLLSSSGSENDSSSTISPRKKKKMKK